MASSYGEDASRSALRSSFLAAQDTISPQYKERLDREVRLHLFSSPAWRKASLILAYVTYRNEMQAEPIAQRAWKDGKRVALPVCKKGVLYFYEVTSLDGLAMGSRGVLEPDPASCAPIGNSEMKDSLCLVPGLVFDAQGYRIGYGAGYYDEFLATYEGTSVGLARSLQVSGNPLPHDDHDIPVDLIVSDGMVWVCSRETA